MPSSSITVTIAITVTLSIALSSSDHESLPLPLPIVDRPPSLGVNTMRPLFSMTGKNTLAISRPGVYLTKSKLALQKIKGKLHAKGKSKESYSGKEDEAGGDDEGDEVCGCCFAATNFKQMVQCTEGHLFCKLCLKSYVSTCLESQNPRLKCMDTSLCEGEFQIRELMKVFGKKSKEMKEFDRLLCERDMLDAGLRVLECAFCSWKCVIDSDEEGEGEGMGRVVICENRACGVTSCVECKRKDHRPKTCQGAREDAVASGRQTVEEAMSDAVVRKCPKCKTPFVKTDGCNKMTCSKCNTVSCYVCRKVITGYGHFKRYSGSDTPKSTEKHCYTFDAIEEREDEIAKEAGDQALKRYIKANPWAKDGVVQVGTSANLPVS